MNLKAGPGHPGGGQLPGRDGRALRGGTQSRQGITQHSKQPPPHTALQTSPAGQLYLKPASRAAIGAGQLEGKRASVTQQCQPRPSPLPSLPWTPISPKPPGPRLGWSREAKGQDRGPQGASQEPHVFRNSRLHED